MHTEMAFISETRVQQICNAKQKIISWLYLHVLPFLQVHLFLNGKKRGKIKICCRNPKWFLLKADWLLKPLHAFLSPLENTESIKTKDMSLEISPQKTSQKSYLSSLRARISFQGLKVILWDKIIIFSR